jgi:hypothetical protein
MLDSIAETGSECRRIDATLDYRTATRDMSSLIIALERIVTSKARTPIKVNRLFQVINQGVSA